MIHRRKECFHEYALCIINYSSVYNSMIWLNISGTLTFENKVFTGNEKKKKNLGEISEK